MRYKPPTIRETGLRLFLAARGIDYDAFVTLVKAGFSAYQIGHAEGFKNKKTGKAYSPGAVEEWIAVYKEEQGK